jgi:hypothetical protein
LEASFPNCSKSSATKGAFITCSTVAAWRTEPLGFGPCVLVLLHRDHRQMLFGGRRLAEVALGVACEVRRHHGAV